MKYSLFIGKWQPFHKGHKWLIEERLKLGKNVLIGIRDTAHDRKQYPKSPSDVKMQVFHLFPNEVNDGTIDFIELPDIESINYGRDVGYDIIEHKPPNDIKEISGTKIRKEIEYRDYIKKVTDMNWTGNFFMTKAIECVGEYQTLPSFFTNILIPTDNKTKDNKTTIPDVPQDSPEEPQSQKPIESTEDTGTIFQG